MTTEEVCHDCENNTGENNIICYKNCHHKIGNCYTECCFKKKEDKTVLKDIIENV